MKFNKKNRRRESDYDNGRNEQQVQWPDRVHMDVLGTMQDEEIIKRLDEMYEGRNASFKSRRSIVPWESEICYLRRELQLRRTRRSTHETYTKRMDVDFKSMQREERNLPSADLDNSRFMFLN